MENKNSTVICTGKVFPMVMGKESFSQKLKLRPGYSDESFTNNTEEGFPQY
jgi:hypothetical protein